MIKKIIFDLDNTLINWEDTYFTYAVENTCKDLNITYSNKILELVINSINNFLDLIFNNAGLVGLFLPLDLVKVILPLVLIVINFNYIYGLILWVLKKIPFINVN